MQQAEVIEKLNRMKMILLHRISDEGYKQPNIYMDEYQTLRTELLAIKTVKPILPHFVEENLDLRMFWRFIRRQYPNHAKRREHIEKAFARTVNLLGSDQE